jgi:hypothetical protein
MVEKLRQLEGHRVGLALADGSRVDECQLVSVPRPPRILSIWIYQGGGDVFLPLASIRDVWERSA